VQAQKPGTPRGSSKGSGTLSVKKGRRPKQQTLEEKQADDQQALTDLKEKFDEAQDVFAFSIDLEGVSDGV
jgi:hypothetical protein